MTKGDLSSMLNYIKSDDELRLEIRRNNEAFVYYRKGKALEVRSLKVDKKYGNTPSTKLAVSNLNPHTNPKSTLLKYLVTRTNIQNNTSS